MIRAGDYLRLARGLPTLRLEELTRGRGLVVVAPHADDESLGCGGLIAAACAQGATVRIVLLSDGSGSHPHSRRFPAEHLRALREAELVRAAAILGLPKRAIDFLRLPDRAVPSGGPEFTRAITSVRAAAREADAGSVFVTWRHDPHCDHQAGFAIARAAIVGLEGVRLYAYPVWGWTLADETLLDEPEPMGGQLDIGPYLVRKRHAIQAHRSQMTRLIDDDPHGFQLPPALLAQFDQPREVFLEIAP